MNYRCKLDGSICPTPETPCKYIVPEPEEDFAPEKAYQESKFQAFLAQERKHALAWFVVAVFVVYFGSHIFIASMKDIVPMFTELLK